MSSEPQLIASALEDIKALLTISRQSNSGISRINDLHDKLATTAEDRRGAQIERVSQKLWTFYEECRRTALEEEKRASAALERLEEVQRERQLMAKIGYFDGISRRPREDLVSGQQVVARVKSQWILASIIRCIDGGYNYEVRDVEPEEDPVHLVPRRLILPLVQNVGVNEIPSGTVVLACFPGSTAFYNATVVSPPSMRGDTNYDVAFEGEDEAGITTRTVPSIHVVLDESKL